MVTEKNCGSSKSKLSAPKLRYINSKLPFKAMAPAPATWFVAM